MAARWKAAVVLLLVVMVVEKDGERKAARRQRAGGVISFEAEKDVVRCYEEKEKYLLVSFRVEML